MTTEEMLLQLIEGQKRTDERLDKIDNRLDKMDERFDKMDNRLDEQYNMIHQLTLNQEAMQKDIKSIKLTLENDISPSIKMLSEFQLENSKRLIKLEKDTTDIKDELAINDVLQGLKENNLI